MGIAYLFNLLFFILPLVFFTKTSELFEFNKIVTVYIFTVIIVSLWIIKMIRSQKIIFRRTILDIPLLLFLGSQALSTIFSIDIHTSIFGYYSRFNGGLLSTLCFCLLYWAYVANIDNNSNRKNIISLLISGVLVSIYGTLEHFGHSISCIFVTGKFNDECWVQDVQLRVFATLGQPNWLAAFLVSIIPFTWVLAFEKVKKPLVWIGASILFFVTVLFTKSRSGLLGFGVEFLIFWGLAILLQRKRQLRKALRLLIFSGVGLVAALAIFGSPWTPSVSELAKKTTTKVEQTTPGATSLETGGTESGIIRQIVWKGALAIWKAYPLTGSGVETFAYAYYQFRPVEHNLVSEWDFLYNKAHNEFLNFMATTGTIGIGAYLFLIGGVILIFVKIVKNKKQEEKVKILTIGLLSGFVSILVTDFFGFSVVLTSFLFFLLPAIAVVGGTKQKMDFDVKGLTNSQKVLTGLALAACGFLLLGIGKYWYADYLYATGKKDFQTQKYADAVAKLRSATNLSPNEAIFHQELANDYTDLALGILDQKDATSAASLASYALDEGQKAFSLSPRNIVIRRSEITVFTKLTVFDETFLDNAVELVNNTIPLAPTDPRLQLTLCKLYYRQGKEKEALTACKKAVELKPDYNDAKAALKELQSLIK